MHPGEYHLDDKLGEDGKIHFQCTCGKWASVCGHWSPEVAQHYLLYEHWTDL